MSETRARNWTSAAEALASGRAGLIWRKLVADTETPVGAAVKLIEPLVPPKQVTGTGVSVATIGAGCATVALVVAVQPLASVTVTV